MEEVKERFTIASHEALCFSCDGIGRVACIENVMYMPLSRLPSDSMLSGTPSSHFCSSFYFETIAVWFFYSKV